MPEVTVREENRPSFGKYVVFTAVGAFLITWLASFPMDSPDSAIAFGGLLLAGVGNIAVLFLMVQSFIEEWFSAAEIVGE